MLKVRLCKDTFIRQYREWGYITSQLTRHDRIYDNIGGIFLSKLSRQEKEIDSIVMELITLFKDAEYHIIKTDFLEFLTELEEQKFIVLGNTTSELNQKEPYFTYSADNPKTLANSYGIHGYNKLPDTAEFFYAKFHEHPAIFGAQIEVTSRCNERCIHCYIPHEMKTTDMKLSLAFDVMNQLSAMGTLGLTISGGEPLLHKDIAAILQYARKMDFSVSVLSNATLLTDELIDIIKEINISLFQVSIYSMNPDEHDVITTVKGSHQKSMGNIEKLIAKDIPVQISCPVMKTNRNSYKDVLLWAYGHKIKAYTDFIMMAKANLDTSNLENRISVQETEALIRDIIEVDEHYRVFCEEIPPRSVDFEKYKNQPVCGVGVDNICVVANGNLYPCAGWQDYVIGNAYEQKIGDVWENSERLKYLRTITNSSFPECLECSAKDYCAMCLVRNYNESGGDMFLINKHFCQVADLNKRLVEEYKSSKSNTNTNAY